jgi:chemotaxis protein CheC
MEILTELQKDALYEIINIGVGKAVSLFNDMLETHIVLELPHIEFLSYNDAHKIKKRVDDITISTVSQPFEGEFSGRSALIFPSDSATRIVETLLDGYNEAAEFEVAKSGTLLEIGNIVNNALLGTISNIFKCNLKFSFPEYQECSPESLVNDCVKSEGSDLGFILFGEVNFFVESIEAQGYIILFFELNPANGLLDLIDRSISELFDE